MILAIDAYYYKEFTKVSGLLFENWAATHANQILSTCLGRPHNYISGAFYKRELPGLLHLLNRVDLNKVSPIVIDGYVFLDHGKNGLGAHLYEALKNKIPVIGVAKSAFYGNSEFTRPIYRGKSKHPLYISAIGMSVTTAADCISRMSGSYRIPDLLRQLDRETRILPGFQY